MSQLGGVVGPIARALGTSSPFRQGKTGEIDIGQAHPRFYEAVLTGNCYVASTATAGVAPGTTIGTTAPFTLANPKNSGKNLCVMAGWMEYVSGTLGSGTVYWVANNNPAAAAVTGTGITPVNLNVGAASANVGLAYTTATVPAAPTTMWPFATLTPILATSVVQPYIVSEYVDGLIVIQPGCSVSFESLAAAGTSPLVIFGMAWEEVPIS
jgi:hypothetical protein